MGDNHACGVTGMVGDLYIPNHPRSDKVGTIPHHPRIQKYRLKYKLLPLIPSTSSLIPAFLPTIYFQQNP